ncbi:MAG: hypothetical protein SynsKO_02730 [Synoicihabitans sp.]
MRRFQHIVTNLSLQDSDAAVLRWTSNLARMAGSKKVTLMYGWQPVDIPPELKARYPWLLEPGEGVAQERMNSLIEENLDLADGVELNRVVFQGSPLGEILHVTQKEDADLVVCGRQVSDIFLSEKLARKAPCSVLTVPAETKTKFQRVMVAVDYSEFSREALDVGLAFAEAEGVALTVFHAFSVPWGQSRATISREEFVRELREFHEKELRAIVDEVGSRGVEVEYSLQESAIKPTAIASAVEEQGHDLVVIGCRGRHAIYATLLGSTAESILRECPAPVVAVKSKNSGKSFLSALSGA